MTNKTFYILTIIVTFGLYSCFSPRNTNVFIYNKKGLKYDSINYFSLKQKKILIKSFLKENKKINFPNKLEKNLKLTTYWNGDFGIIYEVHIYTEQSKDNILQRPSYLFFDKDKQIATPWFSFRNCQIKRRLKNNHYHLNEGKVIFKMIGNEDFVYFFKKMKQYSNTFDFRDTSEIETGDYYDITNRVNYLKESCAIDTSNTIFLDSLYGFISKNKNITLEINSYNSCIKNTRINNNIGDRSIIESIVKYLVNKGANPTKLEGVSRYSGKDQCLELYISRKD